MTRTRGAQRGQRLLGWAEIASAVAAADGLYIVRQQVWDDSAEEWVDGQFPRARDVLAVEANGSTTAVVGDQGYLWRETDNVGAARYILMLPRLPVWGKASADWTNVAGNGSYVTVHPCADKDGASEVAATTHTVYLPRPATAMDPNVRDDQVILYQKIGAVYVCKSSYLDDEIGTIRMRNSASSIPAGWQLADGTNSTLDMRGVLPASYKAGDADFGTVGTGGGTKTHTHDSHTTGYADAFTCPSLGVLTGPTTHSVTKHLPPFNTVAFIQRVD